MSLRDLVGQMRADAALAPTREASLAHEADAQRLEAALADIGTLTDGMIVEKARSIADDVIDATQAEYAHGTVLAALDEIAKWARDYRTPSVPTREQGAALDGLLHALAYNPTKYEPDSIIGHGISALRAMLALFGESEATS